ncbi:transporter substrate-binding domain-containing protein [Pseudodesulfovibrio thermohalotolerans]|uniref:substrate-binding periplasmic protein n=1 Tax=Pseudodesulfovibrio thermohalotolerans TaxID=2880651 RepID=UPI00244320D0|nr:transporter substrate-binding domain-containing protein [Pseudodesulfovibrio thermohalotolerans]WFS62019.1 transporter substrate-binding domain-containing protein [Pseudodesulfovibrio thermohalotolerans]
MLVAKVLVAVPLLAGLLLASPGFAQGTDDAGNLTYLTEEFRPLSYTIDGKPAGLAVSLLKLLWKEMGVPEQPIQVMPWPRVYDTLQLDPHIMIFSMYRTAEREKSFKWVGPIVKGRLALFSLRSRHLKTNSLKNLTGSRIASLRDIAAASKMLRAGFVPTYASNAAHAIQLLESGRVDALALDELRFRQALTTLDIPPETFEIIYVLSEESLCYALSPDTEDTLVARFQKALDTVIKKPDYRKLRARFLN